MTKTPLEMQVVSCLGGDRTRLEVRPCPQPGEGELLLRLRSCGLCGTDLYKLSADTVVPGSVLGHEVVGEVVGVGARARGRDGERFRAGERVVVPHHVPCGDCSLCQRGSETVCAVFRENLLEPGGFSEYVLVRPRAVRRAVWNVPDHISDETSVFLEPAACVLRGIWRAGLSTDGSALVVGCGSMGLLHVAVMKAWSPALRVAVADPIAERRDLACRLGAGIACEPARAVGEVRRWTDDLGVDAVFDTVGGRPVLKDCIAAAREGGSIVLFAHAPPGEQGDVDLNQLFKGERRILGTYSSTPREQEAISDLLAGGRLDPSPLVTAQLPFSRFDDALHRVRSHRDLKVLLYPDT